MEEQWIDLDQESDESDTESILSRSTSSSCITSVTDLSIYHEFDCMIADLHAIQVAQDSALDALHRLQGSILPEDDRILVYDEKEDDLVDFHDIIQRLHENTLHAIESADLSYSFTDELLKWIDHLPSEIEEECPR